MPEMLLLQILGEGKPKKYSKLKTQKQISSISLSLPLSLSLSHSLLLWTLKTKNKVTPSATSHQIDLSLSACHASSPFLHHHGS